MLKKARAVLCLVFIFSVFQSKTVLGKDENLGFYAGPLSVMTETVTETAAQVNGKNSELRKTQQETL